MFKIIKLAYDWKGNSTKDVYIDWTSFKEKNVSNLEDKLFYNKMTMTYFFSQ